MLVNFNKITNYQIIKWENRYDFYYKETMRKVDYLNRINGLADFFF